MVVKVQVSFFTQSNEFEFVGFQWDDVVDVCWVQVYVDGLMFEIVSNNNSWL